MDIFIHDALRTPRGKAKPNGGLAQLKPDELVAGLIDALRKKHAVTPDALILGSVGQVGAQGGNIALVSKFRSNLEDRCLAWCLNNYCVSGLTAISQGSAQIAIGNATQVLAGGVEMMSRVPFMGDKADYYLDKTLPVEKRFLPVALAADRLADDLGISRLQMDEAAEISHARALGAKEDTALSASLVSIGDLDYDECPRRMTLDRLSAMEPSFADLVPPYADVLGRRVEHRHTIAHAPPVCDGAGLALLSTVQTDARARIVAQVEIGGDPAASLTAGFSAMHAVLEKSNLSLNDMDRIEFMEAFAVTIAKFRQDYPDLDEKVNVGGGHMAKGHPMGASGVILLSSLLDALDACHGRFGLVVASGASGVGSAMIVERL